MHRPQSPAESTPPAQLWLRAHGRQALVLAVLYFLFGHASFFVQVDDVLVTPVLFAPEGIALAMALRFGAAVWPGVFAGQLALALSLGLAPWPAVSISAINSLEAVLAVFLFRAFKLEATLPRARDLAGLLLLVFLVLQPFSATLGNATLWAGGIVEPAGLPASWLNWWIGNSFGQMLVAPLLLALFAGGRTKRQTAGDFLVPLLVIVPAFWAADYLLRWTGVSSLVAVFAPILVLLAIYRGLAAVCMGGLLVAVGALYATSHAFGPFVSQGRADIPGLNLFIIGLALSGQFLAVFLRQVSNQQKLADQLRDARERLQRTAYELTENIPVGAYVFYRDPQDNGPRFSFFSERLLQMLDITREELDADPMNAYRPVHPDDLGPFLSISEEAARRKETFDYECRYIIRGKTRWYRLESTPRQLPDGLTVWDGAVIDVTARRQAEDRLRLVLDNLPIAVAATTLTSPAELTFINAQFTRTFGYTLDEVPTVALWAEKAYPDPDYRREVFREWDQAAFRAIETKGSVESMEFEVTCKDGTKRDIIFRAVVLDDSLLTSMTDVTERKKAQAALRSLREELERTAFELTENIPVGTYTMVQPPDGGMAYFSFLSTRFLELTGLEREEARANPMNAFACVHPDDYDEWVRKNAYVFEHKLPFKEECRVVVKGETRWITAESTPRDMPDGSVVWEGVLTDVTARRLAEQALASANRNMQLAASAARLGFWELDVETGLDRWDEEMARINGIALADFDGHWEKFVHADDYDEVMRETQRMLESDEIFAMDYRIVRPSGEVRHIREHGIVSRDPSGRALRANGVLQDITEEKEAADQLQQSSQRMQLAAAAAGIGFWSRDLASRIEQWDDQMLAIYGIRREDFDGRWEPLVHPDDLEQVQESTARALQEGEPGRYEYRIIRPDGTVRHLRGMSVAVRDARGETVREIGVNFDITEEKEAAAREKQLEAQHRRDLETKLKTSLTASAVAHEINQPLSSILLQSKMALQKGEDERQALRLIAEEAQRVVITIDKMKTLLRSVQTNQRGIDLQEIVQSALLYNKGTLTRHHIKLRTEGLDQPCRITGDDAQLQLAITNLLRNAAEAITEAQSRKREIKIDLTATDNGAELVIGDSGPGWPAAGPAEVPLTSTKKAGTGIGLYVVRTAMENHRGQISFGRSPLGGAEVRLKFPRAER